MLLLTTIKSPFKDGQAYSVDLPGFGARLCGIFQNTLYYILDWQLSRAKAEMININFMAA